jgi:hypothetical protein
MRFTVSTEDLRLALRSVGVHADPDDESPTLNRVRLDVGPENLTVSATNRFTAGHALVSIWDNGDGELGPFDLTVTATKEILTLFKGKAGTGDEPDDSMMIEVDSEHTTITDVSGLFPGKSLKLPTCPIATDYPDIGKILHAKISKGSEAANRIVTNGSLISLFCKATAAYKQPLVMDFGGDRAGVLITCGESFIGVLMPVTIDEDTEMLINTWHADWTRRFEDELATT